MKISKENVCLNPMERSSSANSVQRHGFPYRSPLIRAKRKLVNTVRNGAASLHAGQFYETQSHSINSWSNHFNTKRIKLWFGIRIETHEQLQQATTSLKPFILWRCGNQNLRTRPITKFGRLLNVCISQRYLIL